MRRTRRGLLAGVAAVGVAGCLNEPRRRCPGATYRLSLAPTPSVEEPLNLDSDSLPAEADAVIETATEGEHVEHCVAWNPGENETGPSGGLRVVGERLETHTGVDLEGRSEPVETDVRRDGESYRLELHIENG